ncbi:hypothetical protein A5637_24825 [Mycolicibacterium fortuitum]|nr:hypothetical protein A5637_24825 [Mycolicibacterium fortuitum]
MSGSSPFGQAASTLDGADKPPTASVAATVLAMQVLMSRCRVVIRALMSFAFIRVTGRFAV